MRWTEEQYKEWQGTKDSKNKYGAVKTESNGRTYDSKKEAERASELKILEEAGAIKDLQEQVNIELLPPFRQGEKSYRGIYYRADFVYIEDGKQIVEDVKGFKTDVYSIKKKMLLQRYGDFITFKEK